ncbi:MAG TPA: DUF2275 domain-containing protein [Geobacteraceae bacterium]
MNHAEIRRKLSAYLDNAVTKGEKAQIEAHLAQCGNCRGALADLERTVGHLKSLPEVEPPPWLADRIMAHVRDAAVPEPGLWRRLFLPLRVKLPIEALAVVFVCVTGYYLARMNASQAPLTTPIPAAREEAPVPSPAPVPQAQRQAPASAKPPSTAPRAPAAIPQAVPQQREGTGTYAPPPPKAPAPPSAPPAAAPTTVPSLPSYDTREPEERVEARRNAEREARRQMHDAYRQMMQKSRVPEEPRRSTDASGSSNAGAAREILSERPAPEAWDDRAAVRPNQGGALTLTRVEVTLRVGDPAGAVGPIEEAVARSGGTIVRRVYAEAGHLLMVRIEANKVSPLVGRLERIGTLRESPRAGAPGDGVVELSIGW